MVDISKIRPEDYPDMKAYRQAMQDALRANGNPIADMLIVDPAKEKDDNYDYE